MSMRSRSDRTSGETPSTKRLRVRHAVERLLVAESLIDLDGRPGEPPIGADALGVELHEDAHGEPDVPLLQARQAVREHLGQHRDHAIGQVDAGPSLAGGLVQGRSGLDEVRDVGDVDAQGAEPPVVAREADGVVEVPRRRRVDGDDERIAQVGAVLQLGLVEVSRLLSGVFQGVVVEDVGDAERPDDGQRVDARLAALPQDLGDDALALDLRRRIPDHLDGDLVAGLRALRAGVADVDGRGERLAVDLDVAATLLLEVVADEHARGPRDHADDLALVVEAGRVRPLHDLHGHHVARGGVEPAVGGDVDVVVPALRLLGADEAEALRRSAERADEEALVRRGRLREGLVLRQVELSLPDQGLHGRAELGVILDPYGESPRHGLQGDGPVILAGDEAEDFVVVVAHARELSLQPFDAVALRTTCMNRATGAGAPAETAFQDSTSS